MIRIRFIFIIICLWFAIIGNTSSLAQEDLYPVITSENASAIQQIGMMGGDQGRITVSPDNQWMAIGGLEGVWLVNLATDDARLLAGFPGKVNAVNFSPHNDLLASASDDGVIRLWSVPDGDLVHAIEAHSSPITGMDFNSTGDLIASASGGDDNSVRVFDVHTEEQIHVYDDVPQGFRRVEFLNNSPYLLAATLNSSIAMWNLNNDSFLGEINDEFNSTVTSIATTSNGSHIALGLFSGRVIIRDANTGNHTTLDYHDDSVRGVAFSPDGTMLASVGMDARVIIIDTINGEVITQFEREQFTYSVAFSSHNQFVYVASNDGKVTTWDIQHDLIIEERSLSFPAVRQVVYSPDGLLIAAVTEDDMLGRVFDASSYKQIAVLEEHAGRTSAIAFHPLGRALVTAGSGGDVFVWRTDTFEQVDTLHTSEAQLYSVAFSPDPNVIATGSDDFIRLWNIRTKEPIMALNHNNRVQGLSFSPDGSLIATSGGVWNAFQRQKLDLAIDEFASVAISPNSDLLATHDGFIQIEPNRIVPAAKGFVGLNNTNIAFNPNGSLVAMGVDENIWIIDVASQSIITTLTGHNADVRSLAFSPDSTKLISGSDDTTIRQWAVIDDTSIVEDLSPVRMDGLVLTTIPASIPSPTLSESAINADNISQVESTVVRHAISNVVDLDVAVDGSSAVFATLEGVYWIDLTDVTTAPIAMLPTNDAIFDSGLAVDFAGDGTMVAVSHGFARSQEAIGGGVTLWDVSGARPILLNEFVIQGDRGFSVALSNNKDLIAIGFDKSIAQVIDTRNGTLVAVTQQPMFGRINGLSFNHNDSKLSLSDITGNKAFFDTTTGRFLGGFNSGVAVPMRWSPNNDLLYSAEQTGLVLRNGSNTEPIREYPYPEAIRGNIIATDVVNGQLLVSADSVVWFIDFATGKINQQITSFEGAIITAEVTHDGSKLVGVTSDNRLHVWDINSGEQIITITLGISDPFATTIVSHDGRYMVYTFDDGNLRIVSADSGVILHDIDTTPYISMTFVPNLPLLIASKNDNTIDIWNVEPGELIESIATSGEAVMHISPSEKYLVTRQNELLTVQNLHTGEVLFDDVQAHLGHLSNVDISADETLMATAGEDGVVKLWDIETRQQNALIWSHQRGVNQVAFAPNEPLIATMGDDGIRVYDYSRLNNIDEKFIFNLSIEVANALYFSGDGSLLFGHESDKLHVWSMESGIEIETYIIPDAYSRITMDSARIIATDIKGTIVSLAINSEVR